MERRTPWCQLVSDALLETPQPVICVSPLVLMECLVGPLRSGDFGLRDEYREFFAMQAWLGLADEVFELAAELRARYNLKTPDAIHLAAAIHHGCDEFWTNGHRLDRAASDIRIRAFEPAPGPGDATPPEPV